MMSRGKDEYSQRFPGVKWQASGHLRHSSQLRDVSRLPRGHVSTCGGAGTTHTTHCTSWDRPNTLALACSHQPPSVLI